MHERVGKIRFASGGQRAVALCNPDTVNVKLQDQRRGIAEPMDLKAASQRGKTGNGGKLPFHHSGFSATLAAGAISRVRADCAETL